MAVLLTLDASILVAACRPAEKGHTEAIELLRAVQNLSLPLMEPTLLIVEIAAALGRSGIRADPARELAGHIARLPRLTLVNLDARLAEHAAELASTHRLRGADAIYASVALLYGATLVTLDREQLKRHPDALRVLNPAAARALLRT